MNDYSRQQIFDMQRIGSAKITVVGGGNITNYLGIYMAGLGIKNLKIIDWEKGNKEEFITNDSNKGRAEQLEEKLVRINNDMRIKTRQNLDENSLGKPDVLVDLSNSQEIRKICYEYATRKHVQFITAASDENNSSLSTSILVNPHIYEKKKQGTYTSGIVAAITLDEIRKIIMPLKDDNRLKGQIDFSINKLKRFNSGTDPNGTKEKLPFLRTLVVGAGGIGTYVALNLALMGVQEIDIMDGDKIEAHNLNRQVLYYDRVGENKAKVLAERLSDLSKSKIKAIPHYFKDPCQITKKYDIIYSCLDNWEARFKLNTYAMKNNIRLINGAVTTFSAKAEFSTCLECKYDSKLLLKEEQNQKAGSCSNLNANVVMQNALIGGLMASEAKAIALPWKYNTLKGKEIQYHSKNSDPRKFVFLQIPCICNNKRRPIYGT
ncbi:MAG: ThiF family adenylyltransferase [Candidatus Nanoarchaeia archaeon]